MGRAARASIKASDKAEKRTSAKITGRKAKVSVTPPLSVQVRMGDQTIRFKDITKVHPGLRDQFCYCLNKVSARKKSRLESALTRELGIVLSYYSILQLLESDDSVNQNRVADEFGVDKASMVKLIDRLQEMGMIERQQSASDRRVNILKITTKGRKTLSQARKIAEREERDFLKCLTPSETKTFQGILQKLIDKT
jgi:DNA-binding MarR family transcriptional regulator